MKVAISQSNYIPWKGYFDGINTVDAFVLYDEMQYTKNDWRNRNRIKAKDGLRWLTIPVKVKQVWPQKINEAEVADHAWAKNHWKTLQAVYGRAPCFKMYAELFQNAYAEAADLRFLSEINRLFLTMICRVLGIKTPLVDSAQFDLTTGKSERLVHICGRLGATDYYTGPRAKSYLNTDAFRSAGISVHYFDYNGYPVYSQPHGEFVHEVSILDLLFNEGDMAVTKLRSFRGV